MQKEKSVIQPALECICSILFNFGIEHLTPDSFLIAKSSSVKSKTIREETVEHFLKAIHDLILLYKHPTKSVHGLWSKNQFEHAAVVAFVKTFMLQHHYPRVLYFHEGNMRELLHGFCWMFYTSGISERYLKQQVSDQMFHTDATLAFSKELQRMSYERIEDEQAVFRDQDAEETFEFRINKLLMKVNKIYMTTRGLYNKGQQCAILNSELNKLFPKTTPTEFQLVIESISKKKGDKKLDLHEKQIVFATVVYRHLTTFYEWMNSVFAEERLRGEISVENRQVSDNIQMETLQQEVIEKYQNIREKLVKGAEIMKKKKQKRSSPKPTRKSERFIPGLQTFMAMYAKELTIDPTIHPETTSRTAVVDPHCMRQIFTGEDDTFSTREIQRLSHELTVVRNRVESKRKERSKKL